MKITTLLQLYDMLPEHERIIVDVLRNFVIDTVPKNIKEKISYNVPFFYGKKSLVLIWPSTIPRGGIKEGVLFAFWYGHQLKDVNKYLDKGSNKQIFYKVFKTIEAIDFVQLELLLLEAVALDESNFRNINT